jgi:hypothetical protein
MGHGGISYKPELASLKKEDLEMRNALRFLPMFIGFVLPLFSQPHMAEPVEQREIGGKGLIEKYDIDWPTLQLKEAQGRVYPLPLHKSPMVVAEEKFVDNGDGTVTDTRRKIMWQKGDNGKEVTFQEAQEYCKTLRLGGHGDWRLPKPEEGETAVAVELMMPIHSPDTYARFDLYWSSDPTVLIPFNYQPARGKEVLRVYPAREGGKAFVRAVRSLGTAKPDSGS